MEPQELPVKTKVKLNGTAEKGERTMPVRDTSILSYSQVQNIGKKQRVVYDAISAHPDCTDLELTKLLGFVDPNNVRPRRFELVELGLVKSVGKKRCSVSKRVAYAWRITWRIARG